MRGWWHKVFSFILNTREGNMKQIPIFREIDELRKEITRLNRANDELSQAYFLLDEKMDTIKSIMFAKGAFLTFLAVVVFYLIKYFLLD